MFNNKRTNSELSTKTHSNRSESIRFVSGGVDREISALPLDQLEEFQPVELPRLTTRV